MHHHRCRTFHHSAYVASVKEVVFVFEIGLAANPLPGHWMKKMTELTVIPPQ